MSDTNFKRLEREFAAFFSRRLGMDVRRNDAIYRAGDRHRNSDVDVLHERLAIRRMVGGVSRLQYRGITGELKYSSSNHAVIYRWLKEETTNQALKKRGKGRFTVLVINKRFIAFWLDDFFYAYDCFVRGLYSHHQIAQYAHIVHRQTKYEFRGLERAADQAARYAHTMNLFPVPCIRLWGQKQIAFFRISDIEESMKPRELSTEEIEKEDVIVDEVEDDAPALEEHVQSFIMDIEKATADMIGKPTTKRLLLHVVAVVDRVRKRYGEVLLPSVLVGEPGEEKISISFGEMEKPVKKRAPRAKRRRKATKRE